MKRRTVALLLSACSVSVVISMLSFPYAVGLLLYYPMGPMTVTEFENRVKWWPDIWIGRQVTLQGKIVRDTTCYPQMRGMTPPFNYFLEDRKSNAKIGVHWNTTKTTQDPDGQHVTVVGVVRQLGRWRYIEAILVTPHDQDSTWAVHALPVTFMLTSFSRALE